MVVVALVDFCALLVDHVALPLTASHSPAK